MPARKHKLKLVASTPFSEFIRNASFAEKERVYSEVMRKIAERQQRILAEAAAARQQDKAL